MTVLMRLPIPASRATPYASMTHTSMSLVEDLSLHLDRQAVPHFVGAERRVEQERRAGTRVTSRTLIFSSRPNWWQATKSAPSIRYVERIGSGPNRRCETVTDPDFFES